MGRKGERGIVQGLSLDIHLLHEFRKYAKAVGKKEYDLIRDILTKSLENTRKITNSTKKRHIKNAAFCYEEDSRLLKKESIRPSINHKLAQELTQTAEEFGCRRNALAGYFIKQFLDRRSLEQEAEIIIGDNTTANQAPASKEAFKLFEHLHKQR